MATCIKHPFDQAVDICRTCGDEFCEADLVYSYGPSKPPYCIACAIAAAGVRKGAARATKATTGSGRGRVGLLAAAGGLVALGVPLLSRLAG